MIEVSAAGGMVSVFMKSIKLHAWILIIRARKGVWNIVHASSNP